MTFRPEAGCAHWHLRIAGGAPSPFPRHVCSLAPAICSSGRYVGKASARCTLHRPFPPHQQNFWSWAFVTLRIRPSAIITTHHSLLFVLLVSFPTQSSLASRSSNLNITTRGFLSVLRSQIAACPCVLSKLGSASSRPTLNGRFVRSRHRLVSTHDSTSSTSRFVRSYIRQGSGSSTPKSSAPTSPFTRTSSSSSPSSPTWSNAQSNTSYPKPSQ